MTAPSREPDVAALVADFQRGDHSFASFWRALGDSGVFADFADAAGVRRGCQRLEAVGYHHRDLGVFISVISGCGLALPLLARAGGDLGKQLLEEAVAGRTVMAVAITEPSAGSDVLGMRCALRREGDALVLSGRKWNITNAPVADWVIVFCRDETCSSRELRAVLVPGSAGGRDAAAGAAAHRLPELTDR